jgi:uncharacterized protein (TIGR00297 family)
MATELQNVLIGLIISLALGVFSFRRETLSRTGTLAAVLLGVVVFVLGGAAWFGVLAAFFITSVFFTRFKAAQKEEVVREFAKGGVRDFWQVLANGGIAGILAFAWFYYHSPVIFYAFLGVIATVTSDTWATELGILAKGKPRLITNWERVPVGTSGAVSGLGMAVALAGGALIGVTAYYLLGFTQVRGLESSMLMVPIAALSGLAGALFDSLMGATLQAMYYCTKCKKETEKTLHNCGTKTQAIRGFRWFDNDVVNLASTILGAAVAAGLYLLFF